MVRFRRKLSLAAPGKKDGLNDKIIPQLAEAKLLIEVWRRHYNGSSERTYRYVVNRKMFAARYPVTARTGFARVGVGF